MEDHPEYVVERRPTPHEGEKAMCDTKPIDDESERRELRSMRLSLWLTATSAIVIGAVTAWLLMMI